ncbi:MAG: response regulator [Candidatus Heimdallarchaeaceae archaeon]
MILSKIGSSYTFIVSYGEKIPLLLKNKKYKILIKHNNLWGLFLVESVKILIVDDNESIREILSILLNEMQMTEILEAEDGIEAINIFINHEPDLVIMDIIMPNMDGIEATQRILDRFPKANIIGHTAYAASKGELMLKAGAKEVVEKLITRKKLLNKIKECLHSS